MSVEKAVQERTFNDFKLGDDSRRLADGLLFRLAERLGVDIDGAEPDPIKLGNLARALRPGRSEPMAQYVRYDRHQRLTSPWTLREAADLANRSGIAKPLNRSIRNPDIPAPLGYAATKIIPGGGANSQDRAVDLLTSQSRRGGEVIVVSSERLMNSPVEMMNLGVGRFFLNNGRHPTGHEYANSFVIPRLTKHGAYTVDHVELDGMYGAEDEQEAAKGVVDSRPGAFKGNVVIVCAATAGVHQAIQLRAAARTANPQFDASDCPQMFAMTDALCMATNSGLIGHPFYQDPYAALHQVAVTGKVMAETA